MSKSKKFYSSPSVVYYTTYDPNKDVRLSIKTAYLKTKRTRRKSIIASNIFKFNVKQLISIFGPIEKDKD